MYATPAGPQIEQGDVTDGCPLPVVPDAPAPDGQIAVPAGRVVVLTQTCDLVQAKAARAVVALVYSAQLLVDRGVLKAAAVRDQIRGGKTYGWYFLPAAPPPIDLPESVIDLRDLHTIPMTVLDRLVAEGRRACRLVPPYRKHLAQHFAVTYMRIALPAPYPTAP
jgi:hypothetical protein